MKSEINQAAGIENLFRLVRPELCEVEVRLREEAAASLKCVDAMNRYLHESGGKRLRPTLLLLVSRMCGADGDSSIRLGVVVELIHVATLVHDDIIDHSDTRRGRPSLNARWGSEITVLFGDWLYMTAFRIALEEEKFRILEVLIDITRKMVEGELLQLEQNYNLDSTMDDYLRICLHKTAHLFSGCGRLGAMLADSSAEVEQDLSEFGRSLGMAFQITDDLLDYTSAEKTLGKPVLKDLEEGNVTLPIIELMNSADSRDQAFIRRVVDERDFSMENKRKIIELVGRYRSIEKSRRLAHQYTDKARRRLERVDDSVYRQALLALPDLVLNRSK